MMRDLLFTFVMLFVAARPRGGRAIYLGIGTQLEETASQPELSLGVVARGIPTIVGSTVLTAVLTLARTPG